MTAIETHIGRMAYSKGYRYQLREDCACTSLIRLEEHIITQFYEIRKEGTIIAKVGYAYNGANKPAINTKSFRRASLFHDIVRQAVREGRLDPKWLEEGDRLMRRIAKIDGMNRARRWWTFRAVFRHGQWVASKNAGKGDKKIMYIPEKKPEEEDSSGSA